jgi:16S rRNA (cytidine1402-2'-O)-methyltransferase
MKNNITGTLLLVSTPIGNMDDITLRAIKILKNCDLIACEDTRRTSKILKKHNIKKPLNSYHDYNKEEKTPHLLSLISEGKSIALVSDSGTPCISDPGYYLVKRAIQNHYKITVIPGPSSILTALILSGLPTDRFVFEGFLPRKKGKRKREIEKLKIEDRTIIIFESPFRILSLLRELKNSLGDRRASVSRELTKYYEETIRGSLSEIINHFQNKKPKGEFVIVLSSR